MEVEFLMLLITSRPVEGFFAMLSHSMQASLVGQIRGMREWSHSIPLLDVVPVVMTENVRIVVGFSPPVDTSL